MIAITQNGDTTIFECKYSAAGIANAFRYLEGVMKLLTIAIEVRNAGKI